MSAIDIIRDVVIGAIVVREIWIAFKETDKKPRLEIRAPAVPKVGSSERVDAHAETARKYNELIYAVGNKYDGETRHETALRYIRKAEETDASAQASTGPEMSHIAPAGKREQRSLYV